MGILNLTPDSFSDGGRYTDLERALRHAEQMAAEGADIIDVGGESTRPGASAVTAEEEMRRTLPVIEALRTRFSGVISVDTSKPQVMRAAVAAGAGMINDVRALREPGALDAAVALGVPVCLMHMQGEPGTMQEAPRYADVLAEVADFLRERAAVCLARGMEARQILVDPGFGFGKDLSHNLALLRGLPRIGELGFPVLVGLSRKAMIGTLTGRPVDQRVHGSVALAVYAVLHGASIVRVHDVGPTVDAMRAIGAVTGGSGNG